MPKTGLEKAIDVAVSAFTETIMEAVRDMPIEELAALRGEDLIIRPEQEEISEPVPSARPAPVTRAKKKRLPCAYPGCTKNRFVRGHGYCGKHFRMWKRGEIKDAEAYQPQD